MDDNTTTTDEPILPDEAGAEDSAVPTKQDAQPAAKETAEPKQKEDEGAEADDGEALPDVNQDKLASFAKGQGIDSLDDLSKREMALLKSAYDNKAEQDRFRQQATELEKSLKDAPTLTEGATDPELVARIQRMETAHNVTTFWANNPDAKQYEDKMSEIVTTRPEIGQLVNSGYLSLSDLYNLARGGDIGRETELKAKGGKEALEKVAKKQQAKATPGSATSSDLSAPEQEDAFLTAFDAN